MINPQHEKAKQVAANYYENLKRLKIKEKIVRLPPGAGSNKTHILNYKRALKDKPNPAKGKNAVNSLEIAKVGRLHEKGLSVDKIARELGIAYNKARYRLKLYNDEKTKQNPTEIPHGNLPEKPKG